jgi:hypothetical protein
MKLPGKSAEGLTDKEIEAIPQAHWDKFEQTVRELSKRGVQTDLTKRSNLFYDHEKGFSFIDIEGASRDGSPTNKFVEKDGKEHYYPFERYPVLPKEYTSAKDIFNNIKKTSDASTQSKERLQKGDTEGRVEEHAPTEPAGVKKRPQKQKIAIAFSEARGKHQSQKRK